MHPAVDDAEEHTTRPSISTFMPVSAPPRNATLVRSGMWILDSLAWSAEVADTATAAAANFTELRDNIGWVRLTRV